MATDSLQPTPSPSRHEKYYIPSGDVVFRVENKLFRVHRYFFLRESPLFRDMLSLPAPSGTALEGTSDESPIHLPQVSHVDFEHFLWVFYNPKYSIYEASVDAWSAILRLAHRWQFAEIRELAFRELDGLPVPPVARVMLTEKYDAAPAWRAKALAELGARAEPLTLAEGEQLGLAMALRVAELRERIRERDRRPGRGRRYVSRHGYARPVSRSRSRSRSPESWAHLPVHHPIIVQPSLAPPTRPFTPDEPVVPTTPYTAYAPPSQDMQDARYWNIVPYYHQHDTQSNSNRNQSGKRRRLVQFFKSILGRS